MTTDVVVVLCTAPAVGQPPRLGADDLARTLVDEGLCACVNVVPQVRSFFRWQGQVERGEELLLIAKTTTEAAARLQARIVALHPYELPEVLRVAVAEGLPAYLQWLTRSVPRRAE